MRILIPNGFNALKTSEGKVLTTRDTRSQSPQNIFNLLYNTYKIIIGKTYSTSKSGVNL